MAKLIRLARYRFLYVTDQRLTEEEVERMRIQMVRSWPEATLVVVQADEYHDASGEPIDIIRPEDLRSA